MVVNFFMEHFKMISNFIKKYNINKDIVYNAIYKYYNKSITSIS